MRYLCVRCIDASVNTLACSPHALVCISPRQGGEALAMHAARGINISVLSPFVGVYVCGKLCNCNESLARSLAYALGKTLHSVACMDMSQSRH